jgi:hypothetical protein
MKLLINHDPNVHLLLTETGYCRPLKMSKNRQNMLGKNVNKISL